MREGWREHIMSERVGLLGLLTAAKFLSLPSFSSLITPLTLLPFPFHSLPPLLSPLTSLHSYHTPLYSTPLPSSPFLLLYHNSHHSPSFPIFPFLNFPSLALLPSFIPPQSILSHLYSYFAIFFSFLSLSSIRPQRILYPHS